MDENADAAKSQFGKTKSNLKSSGWEPIVQVNEDDEQVLVYMKAVDGHMEGMTVMVVDEEEAVFVNIAGYILPDDINRFSDYLGIDELDGIRAHVNHDDDDD